MSGVRAIGGSTLIFSITKLPPTSQRVLYTQVRLIPSTGIRFPFATLVSSWNGRRGMCWRNAYNTGTSPLLLLLIFVSGEKSENKRRCFSKIRVAIRSSSNHFKT